MSAIPGIDQFQRNDATIVRESGFDPGGEGEASLQGIPK
jgi:hypothetical protein